MEQVRTDGFSFVEFVTNEPAELAKLFGKLGFSSQGLAAGGALLMTQGAAAFVINSEPNPFRDVHGTSVRAIGIRVNDAQAALQQALAGGAKQADPARDGAYVLPMPAILGIGDSLVYFVDKDIAAHFRAAPPSELFVQSSGASILAVDHTSNIVHPVNLDRWADFYKSTFGFSQKQYLEVKGRATGQRARSMVSPCGKVSIPIAAAAHDREGALNQNDEFIRDYGGEGIQHIALLTSDIADTIRHCSANGIEFMDAPTEHYYATLAARIPGHGLDTVQLANDGILVDGKHADRILLQRFTRRQIGPVFFELIERRGEDGFGEGNFKALFESQEQDQVRRGALAG